LKDTEEVLIANHYMDQYTMYNLPSPYGAQSESKQAVLCQFERLHHEYLKSKRKRDFCTKRVYQMFTYLLYAHGDLCIMAKVYHKGAIREAGDIGRQILMDVKESQNSHFI
jgi:hypothetical protein